MKRLYLTLTFFVAMTGLFVPLMAMETFLIDSDGNTTVKNLPLAPSAEDIIGKIAKSLGVIDVKTMHSTLLDTYKKISDKDRELLREYWISPFFNSYLNDPKNVKLIVDYAQQLRRDYQSYDLVCGLGQSRSYEVLTAQLLANLFNEDTNRYCVAAFSGNFAYSTFPSKKSLEKYHTYLKNIGFIGPRNKKIVLCELVEEGHGITSFIKILRAFHEQGMSALPEIKFNLNIHGTCYFKSAGKKSLVQNSDSRIFYGNEDDNYSTIFKKYSHFLFELTATWNSGRLVPSYKSSQWLTTDPLKMKLSASAINRMLCIIDYLHQHLDEYKLDSSKLRSRL